jgi:hypothetical protein
LFAQRTGGQTGQVLYLGGELDPELLVEPPFSVPVSDRTPGRADAVGRASQIASFTSTICSLTAANSA